MAGVCACGQPLPIEHRRGPRRIHCRRSCGRVRTWSGHTKRCIDCGGEFRTPRVRQARCGPCAKSPTLVPCPRCGKPFFPWASGASHARKFCCRAVLAVPPPGPPRPVRVCLWCETEFTIREERQRCCSRRCGAIVRAKLRKLKLRGLSQTLIATATIYRRDAGRCQLCGQRVHKRFRYPHPESATVDHIVPITQGGRHAEDNVQLAHARCNLAKGNRPCRSQLRLALA